MEIIILYEDENGETPEQAENLEWFINQSFKDNDAVLSFNETKVKIVTCSTSLFDFKCPEWTQ